MLRLPLQGPLHQAQDKVVKVAMEQLHLLELALAVEEEEEDTAQAHLIQYFLAPVVAVVVVTMMIRQAALRDSSEERVVELSGSRQTPLPLPEISEVMVRLVLQPRMMQGHQVEVPAVLFI